MSRTTTLTNTANAAANISNRKAATWFRLLTTELFYFQVKRAHGFPALRRNRSANFPASPHALAAAIPVPVFSGPSAAADVTVAEIAVAVAAVRIAVATVVLAETADRIAVEAEAIAAEVVIADAEDLNGGPVAGAADRGAAAVEGPVTAIPADTGIRGVRN